MNYILLLSLCILSTARITSVSQKKQSMQMQKKQPMQSNQVQEINNKEEFAQIIKNNDLVVAEFYSPECPHCKAMKPVAEDVARSHPNVKIIAISARENGNKSLFDANNVNAYPTFIFFKNGRIDSKLVGKSPKEALEKKIDAFAR